MIDIYLDNSAATPTNRRVIQVMNKAMELVGNPSSYNDAGRLAARELSKARQTIARFLGAHEDEIIFTSSGSEANALALNIRGEILTTPIEHKSVLENLSGNVKYIPVIADGLIDLKKLEKMISSKTTLISVMYANNEIGTIEPIRQVSKIIKSLKHKPLFHVDACQATEYLPMNVNQLGVDLLTFNGSKIYGPRGIGVLYVRRGIELKSLVRGGGQERGRRAGTENLSAIVGLAKAVELIDHNKNRSQARLRDYFFVRLATVLPDAKINGALGQNRLPNNINISILGLNSEQLLIELDRYGIRAGSGSACTAREVEPSHVLKSIGVKTPYLDGALRFSLGRQTTEKDIDYVLKVLPEVVKDLRKRYGKQLK